MEISLRSFPGALPLALLTIFLAAGCQDYRPLHAAGVNDLDGGTSMGDEGPLPDDGDAGWPDDDGDTDGDPGPQDGDGPADGDGPVDGGGDQEPTCPSIANEVWVALDCGGLQGMQRGEVIQEGCDIQIDAGLPFCFGQIDQDGSIQVTCSGGVACTAHLHGEGMPFSVECDADCHGAVYPVQGECYDNTQCEPPMICQQWVEEPSDGVFTLCYWGSADPDNTGAPCQGSDDCTSSICLDQTYCTRPCMPDGTCQPFMTGRQCASDADCPGQTFCRGGVCAIPTSCQTVTEYLGADHDGQGHYGWRNLCMPSGRPCLSDRDCQADRVCKLVTDVTTLEGYKTVCRPPGDALAGMGWACNDQCAWDLCLDTGDQRYCTSLCQEDSECVAPQFYGRCEDVEIGLLPGLVAPVRACVQQ